MILATWNVNSISVRLPHVLQWLDENQPTALCLQETKTVDQKFPSESFKEIGYHSVFFGQKTYNGVAILSRSEPSKTINGFSEMPKPDQARFVRAEIDSVTILNSYVPNGGEPGSDKFAYKIEWLNALRKYLDANLDTSQNVLLCGDFNVAPLDIDVHDPEATRGQILVSDQERVALENVRNWGFVDSFRQHVEEGGHYTWWDYRAMAFRRKMGFRIDHIWISKALEKKCVRAWIDVAPRKQERPSDHTPILVELDL
ncbi:MAG: exodeoxyribonuclease III [Candidatus Obscuribacterales bacterium]|nr:exodeoxyribonuclease III [Candidatus Obscuribacterales bacterium]